MDAVHEQKMEEIDTMHKQKMRRDRHHIWIRNEADSLHEYVVHGDGVHDLKCDMKLTEVVLKAILRLDLIYTVFSYVNANTEVNNLATEFI